MIKEIKFWKEERYCLVKVSNNWDIFFFFFFLMWIGTYSDIASSSSSSVIVITSLWLLPTLCRTKKMMFVASLEMIELLALVLFKMLWVGDQILVSFFFFFWLNWDYLPFASSLLSFLFPLCLVSRIFADIVL